MKITELQLRYFVAVAEEVHFGRAAAQLRVSPSSVSEQITALERRLGRTLFDRTSRSVALTTHARELLPLARKVVSSMEEVQGWAQEIEGEETLRIGLMVSSPQFQEIMTTATEKLPHVQWQIRQLGFLGWYESLVKGEVDCVFLIQIGEPTGSEFEALALWDEKCVLVASAAHSLADRERLRMSEIVDEVFVAVTGNAPSAAWFPIITAPAAGRRRAPTARNFEEVLELCSAGLGVNISGESAATSYARPGIRFIPLEDAPSATAYLCLRRERHDGILEQFARLAIKVMHTRS
ncbi:LysR family transcriptional regulator [Paenarthrobacter sp. A20]|uniref:LysR family transcriptional regulator n=1 Tax=Paenarthrobacter sp. A20 TaxID=2817891 RepID=UPI00209DA2AE|nr:LysR family transcriptional regulator [Paenarthrobacter sp. A20]MCP1415587.1 DNA-binding transcriptional LysR family regulator [Paenarthrobacter sp. A20]